MQNKQIRQTSEDNYPPETKLMTKNVTTTYHCKKLSNEQIPKRIINVKMHLNDKFKTIKTRKSNLSKAEMTLDEIDFFILSSLKS